MAFPKKLVSFLIKFLLIIIIVIAVIAGGLFVYYLITMQNAEEYVPDDFALYLKVDSIREIYDNVLDLKAINVILSTPQLNFIRGAFLEFRSNKFFETELFRQLLDRSAHFLVTKDMSPVIIFDPGLLSLGTRAFPLLEIFYNIGDLKITKAVTDPVTVYEYKPASDQVFYFALNNNLIFFSTKKEHILKLYEIKQTGKSVKNNEELNTLSKKISQKGFIEVYISTNDLIGNTLKGIPELNFILKRIKLNSYSILSFFVSNEELHLNAYTNIEVPDETLKDLLSYNPSILGIIKYLPQNTNIFSSIKFKTFKHIYETAIYVKGAQVENTFKTVDDACQFLLGASVQELFFDWTGSEIGAITIGKSLDPVIYLKIKDKAKFEYAFRKIDESLVLDTDTTLVLDEVRVSQIALPGFIKMIAEAFIKGLEMPYYLVIDDYIFFSMNPEHLANMQNYYRQGKHLLNDEKYKNVVKNVPQNSNLFMYYDFATSMPKFLGYNTLLTKLLGLYEKGVFSIRFTDNEIRINITAAGIAGHKTSPYPEFPKKLEHAPVSDIICKNIKGSGTVELIYVDETNNLVIEELFADSAIKAQVEGISAPLVITDESTGSNHIFVFSKSGTVYKFDTGAEPIAPFPIVTSFKGSFNPVPANGNLIFYSQSEKALYLFSAQGDMEKLSVELEHDVLSQPAYLDGMLSFYPKSFENTVWLTGILGNVKSGWPKDGGGISYCSPVLFQDQNSRVLVAFLTQAGQLNVWNAGGQNLSGYPFEFDGVYYADPVPIARGGGVGPGLLVLSEQGVISIIDLQGSVVKAKKLEGGGDKNYKLTVFDFDRDGRDEIFIYGARNTIIGLDNALNLLPGFPIPGSLRPAFSDIDYDGKYELIAGSFDKNLYVYTLDK
jgi:hypothetical protein